MEKLKCGGLNKFVVLKREDLNRLDGNTRGGVTRAANRIGDMRALEGKNPSPEYLVINTDEPYAGEIIEILKRNGHWG